VKLNLAILFIWIIVRNGRIKLLLYHIRIVHRYIEITIYLLCLLTAYYIMTLELCTQTHRRSSLCFIKIIGCRRNLHFHLNTIYMIFTSMLALTTCEIPTPAQSEVEESARCTVHDQVVQHELVLVPGDLSQSAHTLYKQWKELSTMSRNHDKIKNMKHIQYILNLVKTCF